MNRRIDLHLPLLALLLGGCFTVAQTPYPESPATPAPRAGVGVRLSGFEASVTRYVPITGYSTVWAHSHGHYHHGRYHYGYDYPTTVTTTTYVPQRQTTQAYIIMAEDILTAGGFEVRDTAARFAVDVRFDGPFVTDGDTTLECLTYLFSLTTCDRDSRRWRARLRITDLESGRVLLSRDYTQEYDAFVFSIIPVFGSISAEAVDAEYAQNWCLSALTTRMMADATALMAQAPAAPAAPSK